jgi:hypothetical protein
MYGFGVTGPDPQRSLLCMVVVGLLLLPSLLLLAIIRSSVNPPRGVGVADQGLVVTRESAWDARPKSIVTLTSCDPLFHPVRSTRSHVCVQLGTERIWLRRNEHEILLAAADLATQAATAAAPPAL